jgi:hypothetical protein
MACTFFKNRLACTLLSHGMGWDARSFHTGWAGMHALSHGLGWHALSLSRLTSRRQLVPFFSTISILNISTKVSPGFVVNIFVEMFKMEIVEKRGLVADGCDGPILTSITV